MSSASCVRLRTRMRVAVVGHVEWVEFARVERVPVAGEIVHALEAWEEPGGGGAVAAVQLAKLAGECLFLTALGDDETGHRAHDELERMGRARGGGLAARSRSAARSCYVDSAGERTITVIGERLGPSASRRRCPGRSSTRIDAVYFTAGDAGAARAARARRRRSSRPPAALERPRGGRRAARTRWSRAPRTRASATSPATSTRRRALVARTAGAGRRLVRDAADGRSGRWQAAPLPGPGRGRLRRRRLLRGRPDLRARRGPLARGRAGAGAPAAGPPA